MTAVDRGHPFLIAMQDSVVVIVCDLEQSFALSWQQHVQQVKDCVLVVYEAHVVQMVDEPIAKQRGETRMRARKY